MSVSSLFFLPCAAASLAFTLSSASGCVESSLAAPVQAAAQALPADQQQRLAALRAKGAKAPLAVLPALLGGKASKEVGDAVGLVLEQQAGLEAVLPAAGSFEPAATATASADAAALPALLQAHQRATPGGAEFVLLAAFDHEERAFTAVRTWIVDRDGALVWSDALRKGDAAFDRAAPREPMSCCLLVAERVRGLLGLAAPSGEHDGPMKQYWAAKSSLPPKAELDAMAARAAAFRKAGKTATVAVYPVRVADAANPLQRDALVKALAGSCAASAVDADVVVDAKPTSNEQLRLWTLAKAFRAHLEKTPAAADYALLADYVASPDGKQVGAVHLILCTAKGEWVAVDWQNDHHDDFQAVAPQDFDGCRALAVKRFGRLLAGS